MDPSTPRPGRAPTENRRRHGRVHTEELRTSLGRVLDLSAGGMRIRGGFFAPRAGAALMISVQGPDGDFVVCGTVAWSRRSGLFSRELGFRFGALSDEARAALGVLARGGLGLASPRNNVA